MQVEGLGKDVPNGSGVLTILHEIGFEVAAGESVAIVGASGSGKSTLLGLLAGLDLPTRGRVRLAGEDLSALDEDDRAALRGRLLGFVFQAFHLLPSLTALENVMLPLELLDLPEPRVTAETMLVRVGLADRLGHHPKHLSGGEQQRVALARAFAVKPKLLLADEPTGNLDSENSRIVLDMLRQLNRELHQTVIMITHNPEAAAIGTRIISMRDGKIIADQPNDSQ